MKKRWRDELLTFSHYNWDHGIRENREAVSYENAVLTWNGILINVIVNLALFIFYGLYEGSSIETMGFAVVIPIGLILLLLFRRLYGRFEGTEFAMVGIPYLVGTLMLLFCTYMIVSPFVQASFYAYFLVLTLQTTLIIDRPKRKALIVLLWGVMLQVTNLYSYLGEVRQQMTAIHGTIVVLASFLCGWFISWRRMQGFDNERELLYMSTHDRLTRLRNRASLYADFDQFSKDGSICGILVFDINSFKKLNDTYGHIFGDEAIEYVAGILRICEERYGIAFYRYGGDEFVGIHLKLCQDDPQKLLPHIKRRVSEAQLCTMDGIEVTIRISGGYAAYEEGMSLEALVNLADEAMYEDKEEMKRQGLVSFGEEMFVPVRK
ncbi:MAG: GGDEF domain-containing protein [Lachnospiraceae bacterium]|nr:GGDEF domain-containing protein [Lachnospiraceae bacterium]